MLDRGKIIKVEKNLAWVEFASSASCAACGACRRNASDKMMLEAENAIMAKVSDRVEVEISPLPTIAVPFIAFGLPVLCFFLGLGLGGIFSDLIGTILGLICLFIGIILVKLVNNYLAGNKKFRSRIIRIL